MPDSKEVPQAEHSYHIIISGINEATLPQSVKELARSFNFPNNFAEKILTTLPIVFLSNLPRNEIKNLKQKLLKLSKSGIEFTITSSLSPDIAGVIWPVPPNYKEVLSGNTIPYVDYQCEGLSSISCLRPFPKMI